MFSDLKAVIRPATLQDFEALYAIWTQDHIIPYMTFERMPQDEFYLIFETIFKNSEIYVIEEGGKIVGTKRVIYGSGEYAHSVELASFAVDKDYLRKGHGKAFYDYFIKKFTEERNDIARIEIGQETDNPVAYQLACKKNFRVEVIWPDWIRRETGPKEYMDKWHMGARFMTLIVDPSLEKNTVRDIAMFNPELPALNSSPTGIKIQFDELTHKVYCFDDNKLIATCAQHDGIRRLKHIQFWTLNIELNTDSEKLTEFLRELAVRSSYQFKQVEIFVSNQQTQHLIQKLGFHCRGERIGSRKVGNTYYNEIGVDFSFFNVQDAKALLRTIKINDQQKEIVFSQLDTCSRLIQEFSLSKNIDQYAALYLENLAFQITRESLGETRLYNNENAPWSNLIESLSGELKGAFSSLVKIVNPNLKLQHQVIHSDNNNTLQNS